MTSNPIGVVICRIGAVWLAISGVGGIGVVITMVLTSPDMLSSLIGMSFATIFIPLVSAFILWHYAESISATRVGTPGPSMGDSVDKHDLLMIGMYLLGLYLLVLGVVGAVGSEVATWMQAGIYSDSEFIMESRSASTMGQRVSYGMRILLGIVFVMVGRRGLR